MMRRSALHFCLFAVAILGLCGKVFAGTETNVYASKILRVIDPDVSRDIKNRYGRELLRLALAKSGATYRIKTTDDKSPPEARLFQDMANNLSEIDVYWAQTSNEREAMTIPIRIPIDKGLIGWRIAFVKSSNLLLLSKVKTLDDLAKFRAGQGALWPDVEIMQAAGLPVVTGQYRSLLGMLVQDRFDYFPRSIIEIRAEQRLNSELDVEVDSYIALHYPTAMYFFVQPGRKQLAEDIRVGLERCIADGSFDDLFSEYFAFPIKRAQMNRRRVFHLSNPSLNQSTLPLNRPELWYTP
jgi:hypothetical protein